MVRDALEWLEGIADGFRGADRIGTEQDEPEGRRFIQVSNTLAVEIEGRCREAAVELAAVREDVERWREFAEALDALNQAHRLGGHRDIGRIVDRARKARHAIDAARKGEG